MPTKVELRFWGERGDIPTARMTFHRGVTSWRVLFDVLSNENIDPGTDREKIQGVIATWFTPLQEGGGQGYWFTAGKMDIEIASVSLSRDELRMLAYEIISDLEKQQPKSSRTGGPSEGETTFWAHSGWRG